MCCAGCAAVAQAIIDGGLSEYYRHRSALAPTGRELVPEFLRQTAVYDHPTVQQNFVRDVGAHVREAALILEGITCAACVWLNERHIARQPGVRHVQINYATHRAQVRWDERQTHLSEILQAISRIGYLAHPYDPGRNQQILETERKRQLRRLGLAGVMAAQVMTLSEALYLGDGPVTENEFRPFFNWVSLLLTSPVLLYSAQPFFRGAWNDLRHGRAGMDVPVTLGIVTAFLASLWATLTGEGVTYYDSVTMFVFFLLGGRYLELMARKRATEASENLVHALPAMATRLHKDARREELVPVAELGPGDRVLVRPGENIPADGTVLEGRSSVDESLLTGENLPLPKTVDAAVIGGSINIESPLIVRVDKVGPDTVLSSILRLLDRAQTEKPRLAQLADRLAGWFVAAVLVLAAATALYWWQHDITQWLPATIAVLVVTCPCALSLATPAALTAATGSLTRLGLLATRGHALETLARATHFVFDKTGTLTLGRPRLLETRPFASLAAAECRQCAAALEQHSEHPIAQALLAAAGVTSTARDMVNTPGAGIHGTINGEVFYLGTPQFIDEQTGKAPAPADLDDLRRDGGTVVLLATRTQLCAAFVLADALRPGAEALIRGLKQQGKKVMLLTGDHEQAAHRVARELGIDEVGFDLKPADKLARVKALQQQGAVVAMIGDGINDAPVLAAAQVSIAMGRAAHIAAASADMVLLSQHLPHLLDGIRTAQRTLGIIRQNLAWALAYNLLAVPAAALGYVAPWLAALGMSLSSLLVVANALRLVRR
jgi:Cu2+-exporting ATPase